MWMFKGVWPVSVFYLLMEGGIKSEGYETVLTDQETKIQSLKAKLICEIGNCGHTEAASFC